MGVVWGADGEDPMAEVAEKKTAHTPGPWQAVDDEILACDGDVRIADVPLCDGTNPTEWQANARLIAAAPDLLAALKDTSFRLATLIAAFGAFSDANARALDAADNVIRKAEGR
jgi:hypothetical protein